MNYNILFVLFLFLALSSCNSNKANQPANKTKKEKLMLNASHGILEETRQWLWNNPPNSKNREERRIKMSVIQEACDEISPDDFLKYCASWQEDDDALAFEEKHPALCYLQKATVNALDDIRKTKVEQGVAIWYIYNMGYVFKTSESCFGIDIKTSKIEILAEMLDFLLITHEHQDHSSADLIDAMIIAQKPVVTRWKEGTTIVNEASEFNFGDCRVKVDIGDHHYDEPNGQDDMLMFQVDCGKPGNKYTIYHSGDGSNYLKMTPDRKIDLFIVHVDVGMSVEDAIHYLRPQMTFVSHVMELSHSPNPPDAWRWSFDYAFERVKNIPENQTTVLTWGERWLAPKTILH